LKYRIILCVTTKMQMPKQLPPEVEAGIVAMYVAGDSVKLIAQRYAVDVTTVSRLAKRFGVIRSKSEAQAVRAARDACGWDRVGKKGAFQSEKTGRWVPCDSAYEFARMAQLESNPDVVSWWRCSRRIDYKLGEASLVYVPDIEVFMVDGSVIVEEVKPAKMLRLPKNVAKFAAARIHFARLGILFDVVTEDQIGWKAIRHLDGMPLNGVPDEDRKQRRRDSALKHLHAMTPERRAAYNEQARIRESAKRAADREAYNRRMREYRASKKAARAAQQE